MEIDPDKLPEPFGTNIKVWRHTEMICKKLPPVKKETVKNYYEETFNILPKQDVNTTIYRVLPEDTLCVAKQSREKGFKTAILNLADDSFPGGCVATGSSAQEESLFRCSTLSKHIEMRFYPIRDNELLYSCDVVVFKDSIKNNYKLLDIPFSVDIISCPGLRHPMLDNGNLKKDDIDRLRIKVENIFQVAQKNGCESLILGALGCGAWKNPPKDVAEVFKEICVKYDGLFKEVVFAILPKGEIQLFAPNEKDNRGCNLDIFSEIFSSIN